LPFADGGTVCPIDGTALALAPGGALVCARGHNFDRAREGYYNLLVVQHKASRDPGDSKPMVAARRRVLDSGVYAPIAERVSDLVAGIVDRLPEGRDARVLDAGCGEGYYLARIAGRLGAGERHCHCAGIDISKWAVQAAAKRSDFCFWAVGTNRHLPFAPQSLDVIVCMFGFPVWDSFAETLAPGGRVVLADPGPDHLIELRAIIYPQVRSADPAAEIPEAAARAGFCRSDQERLTFQISLDTPDLIADILAMTPHDHRAPVAGRQALAALSSLRVTADIIIRQLGRPRLNEI